MNNKRNHKKTQLSFSTVANTRKLISQLLKKESKLVREESMNVPSEFEKLT